LKIQARWLLANTNKREPKELSHETKYCCLTLYTLYTVPLCCTQRCMYPVWQSYQWRRRSYISFRSAVGR